MKYPALQDPPPMDLFLPLIISIIRFLPLLRKELIIEKQYAAPSTTVNKLLEG